MIITNSEQPVTVAVGAHGDIPAYTFTVAVDPIPEELLLDSNGAGDTFVGGFLAKICQMVSADSSIQ